MPHVLAPLLCLGLLSDTQTGRPLAAWTVHDHLGRRWVDELVHFDIDVPGKPTDWWLADGQGRPVPCQFSDLRYDEPHARTTGKVWTVLTIEPNARAVLNLREGRSAAPDTPLRLSRQKDRLVLANDRLAVVIGRGPGELTPPRRLTELPAPLVSVSLPGGPALGSGTWVNDGPPLRVVQATTETIEEGPVRLTVRYRLVFADGRFYQADIALAWRQDGAIVTEVSDVQAPGTGWCFSFQPGLAADRVFWQNQWAKSDLAGAWERVNTAPTFDREQVICRLRPWSFWWTPGLAQWAGFYRHGGGPLVGVLTLTPSRWSPTQWDGFERTEIPVTARPGGTLDIRLPLAAMTRKGADGKETLEPLRRRWALVLGSAAEAHPAPTAPAALRLRLVKHGEFPLDQVMRYGFDFTPARTGGKNPSLLFGPEDVSRVRRQYREVPELRAVVDKAIQALQKERVGDTLRDKGWREFFTRHYHHNAENWIVAYLGSADPVYAQYLAAVTRGLRQYLMDTWVDAPARPSIGAYGPWFTEFIGRLALYDDLLSGTGQLTADEQSGLRAAHVFFAHVLATRTTGTPTWACAVPTRI